MLRRHWGARAGLSPLWQMRRMTGADICCFDPLQSIPDDLGNVDVVLGLAGIVPGKGDLKLNTDLGCAAVRLGHALGAARVFLSSSAAVYGGAAHALGESKTSHSPTPYGQAKREMEDAAAELGARLNTPVCALRIGNIAGADALLAQAGNARILDRFASGQGPVRSYIGPQALSEILGGLMCQAMNGPLPDVLNVALDGGVAMSDLCAAAGLAVTWHPAPPQAIERVVLDVTALKALMEIPMAEASGIVADWRADFALSEGTPAG